MFQFLVKIWSTILEIWQLSKVSRLVAEITIFLIIVLWSLHLSDSILKLPPILLKILSMTAVLTPWLILIAAVLICYIANREKNSSLILQPYKLHEKVKLGLGEYYDVMTKNGEKFFRITLKEISQQEMPSAYVFNHEHEAVKSITEVATIGFDPGFFINHGSCVRKIILPQVPNEDCFHMCKDTFHEEKHSVYFYKTVNVSDGGHFFRCFVDHINPSKKEVELNIFLIWLN